MEPRVESILKELTLEEKAGLCSGADIWNLKSVERLGLKNHYGRGWTTWIAQAI